MSLAGRIPRELANEARRRTGGNLNAVKKLILAVVATGAGVALWRRRSASRPQQTLWAQATDRV